MTAVDAIPRQVEAEFLVGDRQDCVIGVDLGLGHLRAEAGSSSGYIVPGRRSRRGARRSPALDGRLASLAQQPRPSSGRSFVLC